MSTVATPITCPKCGEWLQLSVGDFAPNDSLDLLLTCECGEPDRNAFVPLFHFLPV
jgi:hypothetical protein